MLPESVRAGGPATADTDGHGIVSPDAETTPMAVILGDRPAAGHDGAAAPSAAEPSAQRGTHGQPTDVRAQPTPPTNSSAGGMRMRGPFEPANNLRADAPEESVSSDASAAPAAPADPAAPAGPAGPAGSAASVTMDQIKDLYLTAEAIGEDALGRHFELVSDRQRQLIREYFDQAVNPEPGTSDNTS